MAMQQERVRRREKTNEKELPFIPGPVPSSDFEIPTVPIQPLQKRNPAIETEKSDTVETFTQHEPKNTEQEEDVETSNALKTESIIIEQSNEEPETNLETEPKEPSMSYGSLRGIVNVSVDKDLIPEEELGPIDLAQSNTPEPLEKPDLGVESKIITDIEKRNEERMKWVDAYAKKTKVKGEDVVIQGLNKEHMEGLRETDSQGLEKESLEGLESIEGGVSTEYMEGLNGGKGSTIEGVSNIGKLGLDTNDMEGLDLSAITTAEKPKKEKTKSSATPWWMGAGKKSLYQPLPSEEITRERNEIPVASYAPAQTVSSHVPGAVINGPSVIDPRLNAGSGYLHSQPDFSIPPQTRHAQHTRPQSSQFSRSSTFSGPLQGFYHPPVRQNTQHQIYASNIQGHTPHGIATTHTSIDMPGARLSELGTGLQYYQDTRTNYYGMGMSQAPLQTLPSTAPQSYVPQSRQTNNYNEIELQPIVSSRSPQVTTNLPELSNRDPIVSNPQPTLQSHYPGMYMQQPVLHSRPPVMTSTGYPVFEHQPLVVPPPAYVPTMNPQVHPPAAPVATPSGSYYYATPANPPAREKWEPYPESVPYPPDLREAAYPPDLKESAFPPDLKDNAYPPSAPAYLHGPKHH